MRRRLAAAARWVLRRALALRRAWLAGSRCVAAAVPAPVRVGVGIGFEVAAARRVPAPRRPEE